MRKLILILGIIFVTCMSFSSEYAEVKEYTPVKDENQVPLFRQFMLYSIQDGLINIYLREDNVLECFGDFGNWQIKGDTLYVYQYWEDIPILDSITKAKKEMPFQKTLLLFNGRNWEDKSYPVNVSAFLISEDGGLLCGIKDPLGTKAFATSSAKRGAIFNYSTCQEEYVRYKYIKERGFDILNEYYDSITWKPIRFGKECGVFNIIGLTKKDMHCAALDAKMDDMIFRIFNPMFYRGPGEISQSDRNFFRFSCWMDSVEIGDNVFLCLYRPQFADSIYKKVRYLCNFPDSIYVLDNEAYGCWFATPDNHSR